MKKFLPVFILTFLFFGLGVIINSSFVSAQPLIIEGETVVGIEKKPRCCKLKHDITGWSAEEEVGYTYAKGTFIIAMADDAEKACPALAGGGIYNQDPNWAGYCMVDAIASIGDIVKYVAMIAVGVALLVAAIMFIAAAGSPEKVKRAKAIFSYSLIGVLIATLAHFLPGVVRFFLGI